MLVCARVCGLASVCVVCGVVPVTNPPLKSPCKPVNVLYVPAEEGTETERRRKGKERSKHEKEQG